MRYIAVFEQSFLLNYHSVYYLRLAFYLLRLLVLISPVRLCCDIINLSGLELECNILLTLSVDNINDVIKYRHLALLYYKIINYSKEQRNTIYTGRKCESQVQAQIIY